MRKIINYEKFLERKLELLLEAKISFSDEFKNLLNNIESPLSKKMLELDFKEVDINRNYMTYNLDKEDSVVFYPDDKAEKQGYRITSSGKSYLGLANSAKNNESYPIKNIRTPDDNQKVNVIKELTKDEIMEILDKTEEQVKQGWGNYDKEISDGIVHISFNTEYGGKQCFYNKKYLVRDIVDVKPSDTKVGRFVANFLSKAGVEFTHDELNDFIVKYKSEIKELKEKFSRFEVVKGNDIRHWYHERNYEDSNKGSLGSSCMRHSNCQNFFSIYTDNDDVVSMIILKSKNDDTKIIGRALLWDADLINRPDETEDAEIKFMDKIYVNDYSDENFFIKYARAHGYYYKAKQDSSDYPLMFDGKELTKDESLITISINSGSYDYYPYIDTVKYFNEDDGILTNDDDQSYDYTLSETEGGDGSCSTCGGRGRMECRACDGDCEVSCDDCYSGTNDCRDCDGSGGIECYECEGSGQLECRECDGDGKVDCEECGGSGMDGDEDCSYCDGSGQVDCNNCDGDGELECNRCDGDGTTDCEECGGGGDIECETCYGNGEVDCYRCDGSGIQDCPDC